MQIYAHWVAEKAAAKKKFVVLVDPDKVKTKNIDTVLYLAQETQVDCFFIGGSLIVNSALDQCIKQIKETCHAPVVLFPGGSMQLSYKADAILFLSLISGRNPELLIGKHVETAPFLRISPLEVIGTGYMLIDGGVSTSVSYMSNTQPIPHSKDDIAVCTAMAGEMLGLKLIYMDAGSGAKMPVTESMIRAVSSNVNIPIIVGGGVRSPEQAAAHARAGADLVVVGNALEKDPQLMIDIAQAIHETSGDIW